MNSNELKPNNAGSVVEKTKARITGVILAGGKSSRMGRDKASVEYKGATLLAHAKRLLQDAQVERTIILGGQFATVDDLHVHHGPARAAYDLMTRLMAQSEDVLVVFVPLDMPEMKAASLQTLVASALTHQVACYFNQHYLPAVFPLNAEFMVIAEDVIKENPQPSMRKLLAAFNAKSIDFDGDEVELVNLNYWEQVTEAGR